MQDICVLVDVDFSSGITSWHHKIIISSSRCSLQSRLGEPCKFNPFLKQGWEIWLIRWIWCQPRLLCEEEFHWGDPSDDDKELPDLKEHLSGTSSASERSKEQVESAEGDSSTSQELPTVWIPHQPNYAHKFMAKVHAVCITYILYYTCMFTRNRLLMCCYSISVCTPYCMNSFIISPIHWTK